jgi:hypothetical protein
MASTPWQTGFKIGEAKGESYPSEMGEVTGELYPSRMGRKPKFGKLRFGLDKILSISESGQSERLS